MATTTVIRKRCDVCGTVADAVENAIGGISPHCGWYHVERPIPFPDRTWDVCSLECLLKLTQELALEYDLNEQDDFWRSVRCTLDELRGISATPVSFHV